MNYYNQFYQQPQQASFIRVQSEQQAKKLGYKGLNGYINDLLKNNTEKSPV